MSRAESIGDRYSDEFMELKERFDMVKKKLDDLHEEWANTKCPSQCADDRVDFTFRESELLAELNHILSATVALMDRTLRKVP